VLVCDILALEGLRCGGLGLGCSDSEGAGRSRKIGHDLLGIV
jgi:hypothetical protein